MSVVCSMLNPESGYMSSMNHQPTKPVVPPWLYKLFTGHQYPYVRRLAKFAQPSEAGGRSFQSRLRR